MKSNTRTVLADTLTNVSSYSSGPLDVGDLNELLVTIGSVTVSNPYPHTVTFLVKAIDANGNLFTLVQLGPLSTTAIVQGVSIGAGLTNVPVAFGDQIQIDLSNIQPDDTVSAQMSIKGK